MVFLLLACLSLIFERRDGGLKALSLGDLAALAATSGVNRTFQTPLDAEDGILYLFAIPSGKLT